MLENSLSQLTNDLYYTDYLNDTHKWCKREKLTYYMYVYIINIYIKCMGF